MVNAIFSIGVGGTFFLVQVWVDSDRAEEDEVLANVTYIRETIRDGGRMDFRNMNLRGANLAGLDLGCDLTATENGALIVEKTDPESFDAITVRSEKCADLSGADLTDANLDNTDLTGAVLENVKFAPSSAKETVLVGATIGGSFDVSFEMMSDLRGASLSVLADEDQVTWPRHKIEMTDTLFVGGRIFTGDPGAGVGPATDVKLVRTRTLGVEAWGNLAIDWGDGCFRSDPTGPCDREVEKEFDAVLWVNDHVSEEVQKQFAAYWYEHPDVMDGSFPDPIY